MSGFSVADLIKPTLESLNSSEEKLFIKETMKRNIDEKNSFQLINTNIINSDNNDRSVMVVPLNSFEEHKNIIRRINSTRNDIVKKSRIENNYISKLSNQSSENLVSDSEITLNSLQSTSQIKFDVNNASDIGSNNNNNTDIISESSPTISAQSFNSVNNLSKEEMTIQSINKTNSDASVFSGSSQTIISNDFNLFPTTISSSSPLSSVTNSPSFGSNTEEQLQILLKLHNLFGITSPNKSMPNNINLTNLNSVDNNLNDQPFFNNILPNPTQNSLGQSNPNISLNSYHETIVPFNSSYIMSIMINNILNKEQLEELNSSTPSSSLYQPYLNYLHHQNYLEQQLPLQKHQQQQQQLYHQQSTELNSQLTAVNRDRLIVNFLKSRFMLDNNCGQNVFQDLNELAKLDHSNISLNNYDNFIKNSIGRNVLITSDSRKPKRIRTAFSPAQLFQLESAFEKNHYVVGQERKDLATDLNLTETQVKVWFQNRRTKYKRLHTDGKEILSDSNSKDQKSLSDGDEDSDDDGDDNDDDDDEDDDDDVDDKLVKRDEEEDNIMIESIHQNQNNLEFQNETHSKHPNSESSKRININTFPIQNSYSITENKQFSPSKECQQYLDNSRLNNQRINDLSEISKINDYTKYTWNSLKQIHENLNTNTGIERKQSSILHSSQHLLNSVNQNLNYLQHSCR
ncbi:unnamed protein product [Schistosoma mattheei]|uniref:Homeobox domain-containing protein n=1 Tax=Schistosoma mattheei TaxID=31246 RepID=A0AA85BHB0_9TREM|nr:unnamed protein product [Schistosoma mattheei]